MDKKTVYIETSILSYLTARPSSDLLAAARQKITTDWWDNQRRRFELLASDLVVEEAGRGETLQPLPVGSKHYRAFPFWQ